MPCDAELRIISLVPRAASLKTMEVHFTPELEKKLSELAALTGREAHELVQDDRISTRDPSASVSIRPVQISVRTIVPAERR